MIKESEDLFMTEVAAYFPLLPIFKVQTQLKTTISNADFQG